MYTAVNTAKITSDAIAHGRCVLSICKLHAFYVAQSSDGALDHRSIPPHLAYDPCFGSLRRSAAQHFRKKRPWVHAVRRIVRARVNAAGLFQMCAQIAGSSLLLHHRFLSPRTLQVFDHDFERMQINISIRAVPRAQPATDAPILDNHLERVPPPDRSYWTTDHAKRVAALPARSRHQILFEPQAFPHQTRYSVVGVGARVHARIATRAIFQIEDKQTLCFHQTLRKKLVDGHTANRLHS